MKVNTEQALTLMVAANVIIRDQFGEEVDWDFLVDHEDLMWYVDE